MSATSVSPKATDFEFVDPLNSWPVGQKENKGQLALFYFPTFHFA